MIAWEPLKKGDLVDVVAPGWACSVDLLDPARELLRGWGLDVRMPFSLLEPWKFFANTDQNRGEFLQKALHAKDSKAVWCLRAASGTHRVLPAVFKKVKPKKAKLVIGFSDITSLHCVLQKKWKWASLHGAMLDRLALNNLDPAIVEQTRAVVFGETDVVEFENLQPLNSAASKAKTIRGLTMGGNLTVIQSLIGTGFLPSFKDAILFFEDVDERGYRLDRMFVHLAQAGVFKGVRAIVLGQFTGGNEPGKKDQPGEPLNYVKWAIENLADSQKIPVFSGLPVGHGHLQWPFPLGAPAEIKGGGLKIQIRGKK